jgi:hypothetical protein
MQVKKCKRCSNELPATFDYFCRKSTGKYGFESICKKCRAAVNREYRLNNSEKIKEINAKYRENNRQHIIEYNRKKYGWKGGIRFKSKEEAIQHEKKSKVLRNQKRRSLAKKLKSDFSLEQWQECKEFFDNRCCYCGKLSDKLQQEHFVSIKHGGEYTIRNIIPACRSCNIKKRDKNFFEWYPKQEFYSLERQSKILHYLSIQESKYKEAN